MLGNFPSFGATPSREELGLQDPTMAPPGFLPDESTVVGNLPGVRSGIPPRMVRLDRKIDRMRGRQQELEDAGRFGRAARVGRRIQRKENLWEKIAGRREFVEGTPGGHYRR
jgi:hypothetical protein